MVRITFLGTGSAFGYDGRLPSAYVIQSSKYTTMLDFGPAALASLKKHSVQSQSIDRIFISHLHADHVVGLAFFMMEDLWVIKRQTKVDIYGPAALREKLIELALFHGKDLAAHVDNLFNFINFEVGDTLQLPDGEVTAFSAFHTANPKMLLLSIDGIKLGYSGDTGFTYENFSKLLAADIIIHECNSYDTSIPNHTRFVDLMDLDIPASKRIYLTHVGQKVVDHSEEIRPPFYLSYDDLIVEV